MDKVQWYRCPLCRKPIFKCLKEFLTQYDFTCMKCYINRREEIKNEHN
jgi:hypothetical protein